MDIAALQTFVGVMRRGSFAAVARERNVAPSSISRAIAGLEDELGVQLFQRTTRRLAPTEAGVVYFERLEAIVEELERARAMASDASDSPRGTLRVTAPLSFAQLHLVPLLPEFARRYPDLSFDLRLSNAMVDLLADRIDVAIRLGKLTDSNLIAHKLCPMVYVVCASPAYLERHGRPQRPTDLAADSAKHECLRYPVPGYSSRWKFRKRGRITEVPVTGRFVIENGIALRDCAAAGMGLTILPRWNVADHLSKGSLVDVFPSYDVTASEFDLAAWLLYPSRRYLPAKVRVFSEFMVKRLRTATPTRTQKTSRRRKSAL